MTVYKYISDLQKKKLGIAIKAWRIEHGLSQDNYLLKNQVKICSRTTLSFIENGNVIKDDFIYYSLFDRMNLPFDPMLNLNKE